MKNVAYRMKTNIKVGLLTLMISFICISCSEDESAERPDPTISFIISPDYVSKDSTIEVGQIFKVGIHAESNGYNNLTNFIANVNDERYLDLGIYAENYDREIEITKGLDDTEEWEFIIRDIDGHWASVNLTISKDAIITYGEITEYLNVQLGAQFSTEYGSFFSTENGIVYDLQGAYNNSGIIDIAYYYDDFDKLEENILASPGANIGETAFPGEYAISNWEMVLTTRYSREELNITTEEFDNAANDSILIANSFAFESGGRKTKFLEPGDMYSFVRGTRTGIFKVVSTTGTTDGNIIIDIKIQK